MPSVHFIAIGGAAMHNLALELHALNWQVSGSDDQIFDPAKSRLNAVGLLPESEGWFPEKIHQGIEIVILGMHARENNPELQKALELKIKVVSYPEFIYHHCQNQTRVVIAGSHGKTTITSMILHVLAYSGQKSDYLVGAQLQGFNRMVKLQGDSEFMVIEGDEYLSSALDRRPKFLWYKPNIALISGIAWDHANVFPTEELYQKQFADFVDSISPGGTLCYCTEDKALTSLVNNSSNTIRRLPYGTPAYIESENLTLLKTPEGDLPLQIFGKHNMQNLEGARLICNQLGVMDEAFYQAMMHFKGAQKRLEPLPGKKSGYRDFAHAPSKVKATVEAVVEKHPNKKCIAVLELHTFSSLNKDYLPQYAETLNASPLALVYFNPMVLKQKGLPNLNETDLKAFFNHPQLLVFTDVKMLKEKAELLWDEQSVLLLMSSGNFSGLEWNFD